MQDLAEKVALVTGGGTSFGRAIALALAAHGVRIVVFGRDERPLAETVGEIAYGGGKARHAVGDVRDPSTLARAADRALETFGRLDFAFSTAWLSGPAAAFTREDAEPSGATSGATALGAAGLGLGATRAALETNVLGLLATFEAALARMSGPGRLVGVIRPSRGGLDHASVAAVEALMGPLAKTLAPRKITCNALAVGVDAEPEEVTPAALLLCGSSGVAITGETLTLG